MENYQMFFACSSSSKPYSSTNYPIPTNNMETNSQVFSNFHGDDHRSSGFLGLKTENDYLVPNLEVINTNKEQLLAQSGSFVVGSSTENEVKSGKNKKGEMIMKKIKKPRYAFQTRSQVDILDDGYRWRKYGQKSVKNNKFPRSYYRCTHQGCNVKKQVQRLTKDEGVVVTTYDGMHTHPIDKPNDNFERILNQMHIYTPFST